MPNKIIIGEALHSIALAMRLILCRLDSGSPIIDRKNMTSVSELLAASAKAVTHIKAIGALALGVIVGIFAAGVYCLSFKRKSIRHDFAVKHKDLDSGADGGLKANLKRWGKLGSNPREPVRSGPGGGRANADSLCDEGFYAVGIKTNSNDTNDCNGCLVNLQVDCRPLNTNEAIRRRVGWPGIARLFGVLCIPLRVPRPGSISSPRLRS